MGRTDSRQRFAANTPEHRILLESIAAQALCGVEGNLEVVAASAEDLGGDRPKVRTGLGAPEALRAHPATREVALHVRRYQRHPTFP